MKKLLNDRNGFTVLEMFIIVIMVAVIGFAGWYVYDHHRAKATTKSQAQSKTVTESNITIPEQIAALRKSVPAQYSNVSEVSMNGTNGNVLYLDYQVPGYSYSALADALPANYSIQFVPKNAKADVPAGVRTAVQSELESAGFVKSDYATKQYGGQQSTNNSDQYFTTSTKVCDINVSKQPNAPWVTLVCDTKTDLAKIAKQAKPFADAYKTGNSNKSPQYIGFAVIAKNKAGTYQNAQASTDGRGAYFYKKTTDTTWHYFGSSLEGLGCTDIVNNPSAKLAFADICNSSAYIN
ncbi:MAG TPA: hypothetical protein VLG47_04545 [Candidatus Saccharimonadales bacterium]|nr:hypothetical protein [Candidatus Saccharimonadales bacterium]